MSLNKNQLREMVTEVLLYLDPEVPMSTAAVELVLLTIATESNGGEYIRQVKGPARGIIQMEPASESDLWGWIEKTQDRSLKTKITTLLGTTPIFARDGTRGVIDLAPMKYNLAYQIAMCRMFYRRVSAPLPEVEIVNWMEPGTRATLLRPDNASLHRLAQYWKKYYNTHLGKGVPEEAVKKYLKYVC